MVDPKTIITYEDDMIHIVTTATHYDIGDLEAADMLARHHNPHVGAALLHHGKEGTTYLLVRNTQRYLDMVLARKNEVAVITTLQEVPNAP